MAFPTNANQVQAFAGAMYGVQVGSVTMAQVNNDIISSGGLNKALNSYYTASFGSVATSTVATTVATNLGLTGDALTAGSSYIAAQLNAAAAGARGEVIANILNLFAGLSADATFGAAATAWNAKVDVAAAYTGAANSAIGAVVTVSDTFVLTTGTDVADEVSATRGTLNSTFKFTAANEKIQAGVGTVNAADTLLDSSTTDNDELNVTGTTGAFTASNIETINLKAPTASTLDLTNVTGVKNVNLSGTNTITVSGFSAATVQPTIALTDITRIVTVTPSTFDGTTTAGTAETLNFTVSGLSYGTTTATQSGLTIGNTTAGAVEVLNIASNGSKANEFAFSNETDQPVTKMNITGAADATIRAAHAVISGVTVDATANTGVVTLRVERNGEGAASTNAANWTGVDNILVTDSDATTDAAVVGSLASGAKVTLGTSFAGNSVLSLQGATDTALKDSITVELKTTAATAAGVTSAKLDVQNVKALNLISSGNPTSSSTTGSNVLDNLVGDFTTITITGDTSLKADLNIDATYGATATTARTVVINASGMTGDAFVNFSDIATSTKVGYTITGTAKNDTVSFALSSVANVVDGGAGNDVLTGGTGNDAITGGDGNDTINISYGNDNVTGGAGNDVFDIDFTTAAADDLVITSADIDATATIAIGDQITAVVNGVSYNYIAASTTMADELAAFVTTHKSAILLAHGVTVSAASPALVFTGKTDGTTFTADVTFFDNGVLTAVAETSAGGSTAKALKTTFTDWASSDILNVNGLAADLVDSGYYEGAIASISGTTTTTGVAVIIETGTSYADATAAGDAIAAEFGTITGDDAAVVVFLNSTTGVAEMYMDADIEQTGTDLVFMGSFSNLTTLTGIASAFSSANFVL